MKKDLLRLSLFLSVLWLPGQSANAQDTVLATQYQTKAASPSNPLGYLNGLRTRVGLGAFAPNATLDMAAKNHALYLASNRATGHNQTRGGQHFTGQQPNDRAFFVGYPSGVIENVASGQASPEHSIDNLMSAIYHRFGLLTFDHDEVGIGWLALGQKNDHNAFVTNSGNTALSLLCSQAEDLPKSGSYSFSKPCRNTALRLESKRMATTHQALWDKAAEWVLWPPPNATQVPPVFYDEDPDPLPDHSVSGYPVSAQFNPKLPAPTQVTLSLFTLAGKPIEPLRLMHQGNDPHKKFTSHQFALFPLKRLDWATEYEALLRYTLNGQTHERRWRFKTTELDTPITTLGAAPARPVPLRRDVSQLFYLLPQGANDRFNQYSVSYSYQGADFKPHIEMVDYNTVRVRLSGGIKGDSATIRFGNGFVLPLVLD